MQGYMIEAIAYSRQVMKIKGDLPIVLSPKSSAGQKCSITRLPHVRPKRGGREGGV